MTVKDDTIRRVARKAAASLVYVDTRLRVRFANRRCHELLGHSADALHGRDLAELVDTVTMRFARLQVADAEKGAAAPREYALRHKDGTKRHVEMSAVADRDAAGRSIGYVLSTAGRPIEAAAQDAPSPTQRELLAAANHALRTPLASIIAALELLQDGRLPASAGAPESLLAMALDNAGRLAAVVEQWLDMGHIDAGATRMRSVPFALAALVKDALAQLAGASAAVVRLEVTPAARRARVTGDPVRLRRTISHLIAAALERSPGGAAVRVQLAVRGERALLSIEDRGRRSPRETDLGLLIAEGIVKRCHGALRLDERAEDGTRAVLELPCLTEEPHA